jgi:hypothetical protein
LWCIGCLLFPLIQLIYIALNWKETKQPFLLMLGGIRLHATCCFHRLRS